MSKSSQNQAQKLAQYRFLHANNRLRTRYGIEMDFDEYLAMCQAFQTNSNKIRGLRLNDVGDKEGWIELRGTWVCAHYKVGQRLIATFMPMPPPLDASKPPTSTLTPSEEVARLRKRLDEINRTQNEMVNERARKQVEDVLKARETAQGNVKRDLKWVMSQVARIENLLAIGNAAEAQDRLRALIRHNFGAALGWMAERANEYEDHVKRAMEDRAYWTKKFEQETPCPKTPAA